MDYRFNVVSDNESNQNHERIKIRRSGRSLKTEWTVHCSCRARCSLSLIAWLNCWVWLVSTVKRGLSFFEKNFNTSFFWFPAQEVSIKVEIPGLCLLFPRTSQDILRGRRWHWSSGENRQVCCGFSFLHLFLCHFRFILAGSSNKSTQVLLVLFGAKIISRRDIAPDQPWILVWASIFRSEKASNPRRPSHSIRHYHPRFLGKCPGPPRLHQPKVHQTWARMAGRCWRDWDPTKNWRSRRRTSSNPRRKRPSHFATTQNGRNWRRNCTPVWKIWKNLGTNCSCLRISVRTRTAWAPRRFAPIYSTTSGESSLSSLNRLDLRPKNRRPRMWSRWRRNGPAILLPGKQLIRPNQSINRRRMKLFNQSINRWWPQWKAGFPVYRLASVLRASRCSCSVRRRGNWRSSCRRRPRSTRRLFVRESRRKWEQPPRTRTRPSWSSRSPVWNGRRIMTGRRSRNGWRRWAKRPRCGEKCLLKWPKSWIPLGKPFFSLWKIYS